MKSKFFSNKHLLTNISSYLTPSEICIFQSCDKTINEKLNPRNNAAINILFYYYTVEKYFTYKDLNEDNGIIVRKYLRGKSWESSINWKLYLRQIFQHFKNFNDEKISNLFLDAIKMHLFLFDLRKENLFLEFSASTYHQIICYDKQFSEKCIYNYYDKFININYIKNNGYNCNVEILKQGLPYENELKCFIKTYNDILGNEDYKLLIERIISYDFVELDKFYEKVNLSKINNINNVIYFILWSNRCFIMYCIYIFETISIFDDDRNEMKFLEEYNQLYTNYINFCLSINSKFENINVIVNYLNYFILKNKTDKKFSLYQLARSIFDKKILERFFDKLINKTSLSLINLFINLFENKKENEESVQIETSNTSLCDIELDENETNDYFYEYNEEKTSKQIIEDIIGNILDMNINKYNSNAINHSKIKLGKEYNKLENVLIERLKEALQNYIKEEKQLLNIFENIEELLKFEQKMQNFTYNPFSFKLINRTKRRMLEESFKILAKNILQIIKNDFKCRIKIDGGKRVVYMNNYELMNNKKCEYDLSELSEKQRMNIEKKKEEEIKNIKSCLYSDNIQGYDVVDTMKLVDEYLANNGIEIVLLMKKMIYFYFKEMEMYEKNDKRIYNILTNKTKKEEESSLIDNFINY